MPQARDARLSFNRGLLSPLAAARIDLERRGLSADESVNWLVRKLGSMMLRPGWGYIGATANNAVSRGIPFVRSVDTVARLEVTEEGLRVWFEDELVTRPTVTAAVTNGLFTSNVASWTDSDEVGGTMAWAAGGYLSLLGNGTAAAIADQEVTVNEANVEHALRIVIERGPVSFQVGSALGGDEYVSETVLGKGTHSIAFTPTANFFIRFFNREARAALVDSVAVEAAGVMVLPVPWVEADLASLRWTQSADVLFVASEGFQQRRIERRGNTSWSITLYQVDNGPFRLLNTTPVTIAASALTGNVTLTASQRLFRSNHVGALFRMTSAGQLVTASITAADNFTDPIRVIGVGGQRAFSIVLSGTWSATVRLQQSFDEAGSWIDVTDGDFTNNAQISFNDELDNQIVYYRIGVKAGEFTSGTVTAILSYSSGSTTGIVRVTAYASALSASAEVLDNLGSTTATSEWSEGSWSDYRGWPSAVALHEGRLWWFGRDKVYGSESDLYDSFDDTVVGDAGPIQRSIGEGPVDKIHWAISLTRMLLGTASMSADIAALRIDGDSPLEARSSSFDDPLTPTNFNLKYASSRAIYVDRSMQRLFESAFSVDAQGYQSTDLNLLTPELNEVGIAGIAVQYKPDLRIHVWRIDGTVALLVFDRIENVICWGELETDGFVEDIVTLPRAVEDHVYYTVRRTIQGSTVRYHEKWALESECRGGTLNKQADSFGVFSAGTPTSTITGATHLAGQEVVVWGDGRDLGTFTVNGSGDIALGAETVEDAVYGLAYSAPWRGTKNAFGDALGIPLSRRTNMNRVGLMLRDTHCLGLKYGQDFDHLNSLPIDDVPGADEEPPDPDTDHVYETKEFEMQPLDGQWGTDSHLCLLAAAPRPCTILAAVVEQTIN